MFSIAGLEHGTHIRCWLRNRLARIELNLIYLRHSFDRAQSQIRFFFSKKKPIFRYMRTTYAEIPSTISTLAWSALDMHWLTPLETDVFSTQPQGSVLDT